MNQLGKALGSKFSRLYVGGGEGLSADDSALMMARRPARLGFGLTPRATEAVAAGGEGKRYAPVIDLTSSAGLQPNRAAGYFERPHAPR